MTNPPQTYRKAPRRGLNYFKELRNAAIWLRRFWLVKVWGMDIHPDTVISLSAKLDKTYNYYSPLLSTEDGIYFYGCYNGPGSSWLYDVLDSDGDVVVSGLRTCAGYYANSVNGLPEGVFAAVKGFESGWMDLTGQWLYAESIFASSNDEMDNGFF